ncbi:unnamed protein product [Effrenium voratum]|uniref:Acyltransferase 3 domain-containing protein n=1 Tax=Effrenium voratum TaxID=2562239 RepID=A0AA36NIK7_9DINO|nr:unnamed protein product [Effrenium voratum]
MTTTSKHVDKRRGARGLVAAVIVAATLLSQYAGWAFLAPAQEPSANSVIFDSRATQLHSAEPIQEESVFSSRVSFLVAGAALVGGARAIRHRPQQQQLAAEASEAGAPPPKPKKVRITSFDSIRFFLIAYIVCGHFITFAGPNEFAFKAISQINVVVGAFFALSGYVAAYTTTENAERAASAKLLNTPSPKWILQKVFGYFPLHLLVLLLFSPAFLFADVNFNGWPTAIWHGFLSAGMLQAWFPMHAEIWNAPTWFLSALTFATAALPFSLPVLAKQSKAQLRRTGLMLFVIGLLPKLGYCYDFQAWGMLEGAMNPKALPNLAMFNMQRFSPFYALIEVLLGAVACRLVMLDGADGEEEVALAAAADTTARIRAAAASATPSGRREESPRMPWALVPMPLCYWDKAQERSLERSSLERSEREDLQTLRRHREELQKELADLRGRLQELEDTNKRLEQALAERQRGTLNLGRTWK